MGRPNTRTQARRPALIQTNKLNFRDKSLRMDTCDSRAILH